MIFQIEFSNQSKKFIYNCDKILQKRIIKKVEILQDKPVPHDAKRVVGEKNTFRIRIGDFRVLYEIIWENKIILITRIDKRSKAYK